jgi:hypothetical protein
MTFINVASCEEQEPSGICIRMIYAVPRNCPGPPVPVRSLKTHRTSSVVLWTIGDWQFLEGPNSSELKAWYLRTLSKPSPLPS